MVEVGSRDKIPKKYLFPRPVFGLKYMNKHKDGSCIALNRQTGECKIYDQRPTICRMLNPETCFCEYARAEMLIRRVTNFETVNG